MGSCGRDGIVRPTLEARSGRGLIGDGGRRARRTDHTTWGLVLPVAQTDVATAGLVVRARMDTHLRAQRSCRSLVLAAEGEPRRSFADTCGLRPQRIPEHSLEFVVLPAQTTGLGVVRSGLSVDVDRSFDCFGGARIARGRLASTALLAMGQLRFISELEDRAAERAVFLTVARLFATGRIVDWILMFMLLELIASMAVRNRLKRGLKLSELLASLSAGAALLFALRAALAGARWQSVAVWLIAALAAHLWDLKLRWAAARTH